MNSLTVHYPRFQNPQNTDNDVFIFYKITFQNTTGLVPVFQSGGKDTRVFFPSKFFSKKIKNKIPGLKVLPLFQKVSVV